MKGVLRLLMLLGAATIVATTDPSDAQADDGSRMMIEYSIRVCERHFERAAEERAAVKTRAQWRQRQQYILESFERGIGGLPKEKTPLNPRVVGRIDHDDYYVEKLIFESQPRFYVPALIYIPKGRQLPMPAVLVACGHAENAKAYEKYQTVCIGLAKKGNVALCYDTIGQAERKQYWDAKAGKSRLGGGTTEHAHVGHQCWLAGSGLARHMIWDSIRAVDYLCSRKEVDQQRIGMTGCSGGGTNTSWTVPLEPRIKLSSPVCFVTTLRERTLTEMIADPEQNPLPALKLGIDHHDISAAIAPRYLLINAAEKDFFPVAGARETFEECRRIYTILGVPQRVALSVAPGGHGYDKVQREATYAWVNKWFQTGESDEEPAIEVEDEKDLLCTDTGQVSTSLGGETVFTLNRSYAESVRRPAPTLDSAADVEAWQAEVREKLVRMTGYEPVAHQLVVAHGEVTERGEVSVERLEYETEAGITIPALLFRPQESRGAAILHVNAAGKDADAGEGGVLERLARAGHVVLAIDARGYGETSPEPTGRDRAGGWAAFGLGAVPNYTYNAFLCGETAVGWRMRDVMRSADLLLDRMADGRPLALIGGGSAGIVALHAAALDERFAAVIVNGALASYWSCVANEIYRHRVDSFIPGVIAEYELEDVAGAIAPRPLLIANARDHMNEALSAERAEAAYQLSGRAYRLLGVPGSLTIATVADGERGQAYVEWLARVAPSAAAE